MTSLAASLWLRVRRTDIISSGDRTRAQAPWAVICDTGRHRRRAPARIPYRLPTVVEEMTSWAPGVCVGVGGGAMTRQFLGKVGRYLMLMCNGLGCTLHFRSGQAARKVGTRTGPT